MKEPQIHSHITDELPKDHPLAFESVYCSACGGMLHCDNNECMQTWIEAGHGNWCIKCFAKIHGVDMLRYGFRLDGKGNR